MMAERGDGELVQDIREAIDRIERYTQGMAYTQFRTDTKTQDAVVRNLGILGEAVKGLSQDYRDKADTVDWNAIARMRDRLIHHYFGVNRDIVWDVIATKLPELKAALTAGDEP